MKFEKLKFRAWDGKEMHYGVMPFAWDFAISRLWHRCEKSNGDGILGSGGSKAEFLVPAIAYKEIMQFAGFTDKDKEDLYDGDIVEHDGNLYAIEWGFSAWVLVNYQIFIQPLLIPNHSAMLRKGNIYENPDLLNTPSK